MLLQARLILVVVLLFSHGHRVLPVVLWPIEIRQLLRLRVLLQLWAMLRLMLRLVVTLKVMVCGNRGLVKGRLRVVRIDRGCGMRMMLKL